MSFNRLIVEREVHAFNYSCIKHRTSICAICTWHDLVMVVITGVEKAEVRFEQGERRCAVEWKDSLREKEERKRQREREMMDICNRKERQEENSGGYYEDVKSFGDR